MKQEQKTKIELDVNFSMDEAKVILTNSNGDTYTSRSEELQDFLFAANANTQPNIWVDVLDRLPELTEPLMGYDDNNERIVIIPNFRATVLAWNEILGIYKAEFVKHGWSEISSISSQGTKDAIPSHWMPLPTPPNNNQSI
jgi:hypothetical protein